MRNPEAPLHLTIGDAFKDTIKRGVRVIAAARDPVAIPTDPTIVAIAEKALCHLGLGTNCFTLTNVYGIEMEIPYGASVEQWQAAADKLLKGAMDAT
jgi:hypothetical protein